MVVVVENGLVDVPVPVDGFHIIHGIKTREVYVEERGGALQ